MYQMWGQMKFLFAIRKINLCKKCSRLRQVYHNILPYYKTRQILMIRISKPFGLMLCSLQCIMNSTQKRKVKTCNCYFNCAIVHICTVVTSAAALNVVEGKGFIKMINFINPKLKIPKRKHFSDIRISRIYANTVV